jgi:diguanylate cyclase (GGDEF)-like protein
MARARVARAAAVVAATVAGAVLLVVAPLERQMTAALLIMLACVGFGSLAPALGEVASAWLCPTDGDRARMIEAGTRVRGARSVASAGLGVTLLVCVPWLGWLPLAFYVVSMVQVLTLDRRIARSSRPENAIAFSLVFTVGTIAAGVPGTGGPESPLTVWVVLPAALMASRFRRAVVIVGCLWCLVVLTGATVAFDAEAFLRDPTMLVVTTALLLGVAACSLALSENEMQFRLASRFDHLTGLLNRSALATRMADLDNTAGRVALVLFDIDLFKRINDVHGHDHGDEVLKRTAEVLMRESRAADQVYRLGGEEFAVILPDTSLDEAAPVAQRLREAVSRSRPGGLDVTMSAGVSAAVGAETRWEALYRRADAALLEAKRAGRDQVVTAPDGGPPAPTSTPVPLARTAPPVSPRA